MTIKSIVDVEVVIFSFKDDNMGIKVRKVRYTLEKDFGSEND